MEGQYKTKIFLKHLIMLPIIVLILCLSNTIVFAQPQAGSTITNIASGDFYDEQGNLQVLNSNPVVLTVEPIYSLTLQNNQQNIGTIGSKLDFPHVLTNTGNIVDQYQLGLSQSTTDQFDLDGVAVYIDRNQDGLPDDDNNLLTIGSTLGLEPGESVSVVVVGSIPATVSTGNIANFTLTATSEYSNAIVATVDDTVTVVDDAVIQVTKLQSISTGKTGTEITYTLTYTNTGTASGRLVVSDILPADVTYVAGSAVWGNGSGALTDANDTETGANAAISYQYQAGQVEFELADIAALSRGTVSFKVTVNADAAEKIANTANYQQSNITTNNVLKDTSTNTVIFTVQQSLGVVINNRATDANDSGDPTSAPYNLITITGVEAGSSQDVIFNNYVWNTGQATDTYNLTINKTNVPSCAVVRLYHSDGRTLLTDSNADGIVDTGTMAAGQSKAIQVGVYFPYNCTFTGTMDIDVVATSITDVSVQNSTRDQITDVVITGETDLYNSDNSGIGVANVDDAGNAWLTKSGARGESVVFPLVIKNDGILPNNYDLYASSSVIDLNSISTSLPAEWKVRFYEGDATCENLTAEITNSGNIAAGGTKAYCAVVSIPTGTTLDALPIWFAIKSPLNGQGDVILDQVTIASERQMTLNNDQQGQVNIGGTTVYLHTLRNEGSVTEGAALGDVSLSVVPQDSNDGFIYTLYYDANANGIIDAGDPLAEDLYTITGAGLLPNQSIQLLVKVQAPATAAYGVSSIVNVVATPNTTINGLTLAPMQNTDLTVVSETQLRLIKEQVKDEPCTLTDVVNASYVTTVVQVKPDQCVTYRLTIKNEGATIADNVIINDSVPAYSELRTSLPPSVSKGTVTVTSTQITGNIGTLASSEQAELYFSIRVSP